jgi:ribosomal protein L11 methyltransferase
MLELFPAGFEEAERRGVLELAAYTDAAGATSMWRAFGEFSWSEVPEDWQHRWREFHHGVRIGRLWVGPPWEADEADAEATVVIDPGRAFGTGAHPTTRLCLEYLLALAPEGGDVLDLGCGSGVLAIAAAKLGFAPVLAVDHDPATLEAAAENVRANGVDVELCLLDAVDDPLPAAGLAVANIAATTIEALAPRLETRRLVTSGYLASAAVEAEGFRVVERRTLDGWAAELRQRRPE